jgi:cytochrome c biogenesis protein CcdA
MLTLALLVTAIAVADSINPSTLVPGLYLAGAPRARGLASFTAGFFVVNLAGGLALVFGPGRALIASLEHIGPTLEHVIEACAGLALVAFAVVAWRSRNAAGPAGRTPRRHGRGSAFALGACIAVIEFPTAFMYFGAVSAILVADPAAPVQVALVIAYNALFVLPLVVLLAVRLHAGERAERRVAAARARLRDDAPRIVAAVAGAAGTVLASLGAGGLLLSS